MCFSSRPGFSCYTYSSCIALTVMCTYGKINEAIIQALLPRGLGWYDYVTQLANQ